jgi:uncharacterized protein (DUF1919 family)
MSAIPLRSVLAARRSAPLLRWLVGDLEFSIVSNNCWGAHVYQVLDLPYRTPFVGLFIPPKSYLNLLQNFDDCMRSDLEFVSQSKLESFNSWRHKERLTYPIGLLCGRVEIHFLHYGSEAEVQAKWQRRCARLVDDPQRLFFKFDDRDSATCDDIEAFCRLPYGHKVCFTAHAVSRPTVLAPAEPGTGHVIDGESLGQISYRHFNTLRWLSTRPGWLRLPSLL